ncbi:MAG: class II fructose-bisphosphate aldolase [Desulfatibacillaceae bacterium]
MPLKQAIRSGAFFWAFNMNDTHEVRPLLRSMGRNNSPAIMSISPKAAGYADLEILFRACDTARGRFPDRLYLMLDHAGDPELILECARLGFDAVMVDCSHLPLEENAAFVNSMKDRIAGIAPDMVVEAEVGHVASHYHGGAGHRKTTRKDVARFTEICEVDLLAISVGNEHGKDFPKPRLDLDLLRELHATPHPPFVLHGGDWIDGGDLAAAAGLGMRKVNVGPETLRVFGESLRRRTREDEEYVKDYRELFTEVEKDVARVYDEKFALIS